MIITLQIKDFNKYIDFVWELAQDQTKSGYPTYTDGIKTKQDFVNRERKAFSSENEGILLFTLNGQIEGWIHYYAQPQDNYLGTCTFNVRTGISTALEEFTAYTRKHFPGYELYLGFPKCNREAVAYLQKKGFECIEESFNDVLFLNTYKLLPESPQIVPVNRENFARFRDIHDRIQGQMYWNSDRLFNNLNNWKIYLYEKNGKAAGAIYYIDKKVMLEIFGVDFFNGVYDQEVFQALLTRVLNEEKKNGAKYFCFFSDRDSHSTCLELGFHSVGEYVCYWKRI